MWKIECGSKIAVVAALCLTLSGLGGATALAQSDPCIVADDGSGTVELPPAGCSYLSPTEVHLIIGGLPVGTTIKMAPIHRDFICRTLGDCGQPGGGLGGELEDFDSMLVFQLTGTGTLTGFRRVLAIPAVVQTHTAPRTPGDPVQTFDTDMFSLVGALPPGDPDFSSLQLSAGTAFGLPSPGQTTLTDRGDGTFQVDSFFDITYKVVFQGNPAGILAGMGGTSFSIMRVGAVGESNPCIAPDDGSGTVVLPPPGCDYLSPQEVHQITDGLPVGTTIDLDPRHTAFFCTGPGGVCGQPGGTLGGQQELFDSILVFQLEGTGSLAGFRRTLRLPALVETHTGPRTPGDAVQSFPTDMVNLLGTLPPGDPDFASLVVTGGTDNGLPSPGHTTLTDLGDGTFNVDSFFDITYQIDFQGAPGGALAGLSGSTTAQSTVRALEGWPEAIEPDDGTGTVTLPPEGSGYVSPQDLHMMIDGLPAGTTIEIDPKHRFFFCDPVPCGQPGGTLGGQVEIFGSTLDLDMTGTGALAGFKRTLQVPVAVETHTAPRLPPATLTKGVVSPQPQSFDTEMFSLQGALPPGDPDFSQLTITAGTGNSLPSPGHTTLTDLGDGTFMVDSFFDITYDISFVGAPGGQLSGMSGTTQDTTRVTACDEAAAPAHNITIVVDSRPDDGSDVPFTGDLGSFSLDDDGDAVLPNRRTFHNLGPGAYNVTASPTAPWILLRIICQDPDSGSSVDLAMNQAQADLDLGESILCTFEVVRGTDFIFADGFESGKTSSWSRTKP